VFSQIIRNMKKTLRKIVEEAQGDEEYKKLYDYVRRVSTEKIVELITHAIFLKSELQKLRMILVRISPHVSVLVEDIRSDIQLFLHSLLTILFSFDVRKIDGEIVGFIDLNPNVERALKEFFDVSKSVEYIYESHKEFLVSKPKVIIPPEQLGSLAELDERYDIVIAGTNEEKFISSVFGVSPPYLMINGTIIPLPTRVVNPDFVDRIYEVVLTQKKTLPFHLHLKYLPLKLIEAIIGRNLRKIKKIIFELRSALSLTMEILIKHFIHLSLKYPEFFAPYSFAMIELNKLYSITEEEQLSFLSGVLIALCCADISALADMYYKGYPDIKEVSPVAVIIFRKGCPHCEEVKQANETLLEQKKYKGKIEIREIVVDEYDIEGASFYCVVVGYGKYESTSTDVPLLVFSSKVELLGVEIDRDTGEQRPSDIGTYIDEIVSDLERSLKIDIFAKPKERKTERRPLGLSHSPTTTTSRTTFSYASRKEIHALILRMAKDGFTAPEISDIIFNRYGYEIKPRSIFVLIWKLTGMGIKQLRQLSEEEFEKLMNKLFPQLQKYKMVPWKR